MNKSEIGVLHLESVFVGVERMAIKIINSQDLESEGQGRQLLHKVPVTSQTYNNKVRLMVRGLLLKKRKHIKTTMMVKACY